MQIVAPDRLESWKQVADFLNRDVRTVMRWAETKGMPIHRVPGGKKPRIYAYRSEIQRWLNKDQTDENALMPAACGLLSASRIAIPVLLIALVTAVTALFVERRTSANTRVATLQQITNDGVFKLGLVADSSHVYFAELQDGKSLLRRITIATGKVDALATPEGQAIPADISSQEQLLVLVHTGHEEEKQLWSVPPQGVPERLGNIISHAAVWSRDGQAVYYASERSIYVTSDGGHSSRELVRFRDIPRDLRLSPDGRFLDILLCEPTSSSCSLWQLALDGTAAPKVVTAAIPNCCGSWANLPNGTSYFLEAGWPTGQIWMIESRTGHSVSIKPVSLGLHDVDALAATPSKLFLKNKGPDRSELVRFDELKQMFTPVLPGVSATFLDFSRDGKHMVYVESGKTLWMAEANGAAPVLLYSSDDELELPRWSPDGMRIAYTAKRRNKPWRIFVIEARAGSMTKEASYNGDNQGAPTWAPDGTSLAYADIACEELHSCAVHHIDLKTRSVSTLPGSEGLRTARWSPDGRYIAALDPAHHAIRLFDVQAQIWRTIGEDINGDDLAWSHDSRFVYANREATQSPGIYRLRIDGGRPSIVADITMLNRLSGYVFSWFCLTPDDNVIVSRKLETDEIYALDIR